MVQGFEKCVLDIIPTQLLVEDNARGQLISNSNNPLDCRGDCHTILVGSVQKNPTV